MNKKQTHDGKLLKAVLKGTAKSSSILIISSVLLAPLNPSYTKAYFTDKITSANPHNSHVLSTFSNINSSSVSLSFDVHRFNNLVIDLEIDFMDDILVASLMIPSDYGFEASDILIDSLELIYGNQVIEVPPASVTTNGTELRLTFNWSSIERFLDGRDNSPSFELTGKGAGEGLSGLGERFIFSGSGSLPDLAAEFFDQMGSLCSLRGIQTIIIPQGEEGAQSYAYSFYLDGEEISADEILWELASRVPGVEFGSGTLTVYSSAQPGELVIKARLKAKSYITAELAVELIKIEEEIFEELPEELPVELPEEETGKGQEPTAGDENQTVEEGEKPTESDEEETVGEDEDQSAGDEDGTAGEGGEEPVDDEKGTGDEGEDQSREDENENTDKGETPAVEDSDETTGEDEAAGENENEGSSESQEPTKAEDNRDSSGSERPAVNDEGEASGNGVESVLQVSYHPATVSGGKQHNYATWTFILDSDAITFFRRV